MSHTPNHAAPTLDELTASAVALQAAALDTLNDARAQAASLSGQGLDALRDTSRQWRRNAQQASDQTAAYIRHEPFKAVLIATLAGAALMGLAGWLQRSRAPRDGR